jgi:hypothetical protein
MYNYTRVQHVHVRNFTITNSNRNQNPTGSVPNLGNSTHMNTLVTDHRPTRPRDSKHFPMVTGLASKSFSFCSFLTASVLRTVAITVSFLRSCFHGVHHGYIVETDSIEVVVLSKYYDRFLLW